jgi:hypothetical protein
MVIGFTSQEDKHEVLFEFYNNLFGTTRNRQSVTSGDPTIDEMGAGALVEED